MARTKRIEAPVDSSAPYQWEKERQEDRKMIKGIFQDSEVKGGTVEFPFRKYKGDKIEWYRLVDGCEYTLPLGVVKHLNSGCYYQEEAYSKDLISHDGYPLKNPNPKKHHRFAFKPTEFN